MSYSMYAFICLYLCDRKNKNCKTHKKKDHKLNLIQLFTLGVLKIVSFILLRFLSFTMSFTLLTWRYDHTEYKLKSCKARIFLP